MKSIKSRYNYDETKPLRQPYKHQNKIYNAYFKGYDNVEQKFVLISQYSAAKFSNIDQIAKRINSIKNNKHKNLAQVYQVVVFQAQCKIILVLQWCEGGSIMNYLLKDEKKATEKKGQQLIDYKLALRIISEISQAIQYLHSKDVIHRSINMQNIEIDKDGVIKLTVKCLIFKSYYLSPQQRQNQQKTKQNDIFSLGVSFYRLLYGCSPFKGDSLDTYTQNVKKKPKFQPKFKSLFPILIPDQVKQLIQIMLHFQPNKRSQFLNKIKSINIKNTTNKIHPDIFHAILGNQFINILTNQQLYDHTNLTVLNLDKKKFNQMTIIKSDGKKIKQYNDNILQPFIKVKNQNLIKIQHHSVMSNNYLLLITPYSSYGSLKQYKSLMNNHFSQQLIQVVISKTKNGLKSLSFPYNFLNNTSIFILSDSVLLNLPNFPTTSYLTSLKDRKLKIDFISPQVREGKYHQNNNSDSWSLGVIQYWMKYSKMPDFDNHDKLLIPNMQKQSPDLINKFNYVLQKNPAKRSNLLKSKVQSPNFQQFHQKSPQNISNAKRSPRKNQYESQIIQNQQPIRKSSYQSSKIKSPPKQKIKNTKQQIKQPSPLKISNHSQLINQSQIKIVQIEDGRKKIPKRNQVESRKLSRKNKSVNSNQKNITIQKQKIQVLQDNKVQKIGQKIYNKFIILQPLQKSQTKNFRKLLKCLIAILFYIFLFYFYFWKNAGPLINERFLYQSLIVPIRTFETDTIPSINYTLITKQSSYTYSILTNSTIVKVRDVYKCQSSNFQRNNILSVFSSSGLGVYLVFGMIFSLLNLFFICLAIIRLDFAKAFSLTPFQQNIFAPMLNFIIIQMALSSLTSCFYLIYGGLFHLITSPCFQKPLLPSLQYIFKNWSDSFASRYIWIYIGLIIAYSTISYISLKPNKSNHKAFYIVLGCLYVAGVGFRGMGGYVKGSVQSVFGVCGELLSLLTGLLLFVIDLIFGGYLKMKGQTLQKQVDNKNDKKQMNKTQDILFQDINDTLSN